MAPHSVATQWVGGLVLVYEEFGDLRWHDSWRSVYRWDSSGKAMWWHYGSRSWKADLQIGTSEFSALPEATEAIRQEHEVGCPEAPIRKTKFMLMHAIPGSNAIILMLLRSHYDVIVAVA